RPDKFGGTSLTGVQPYMGTAIPNLHGSVVFTDLAKTPLTGGSGYDPFNLSQDDLEIAGKIFEIDVSRDTVINNPPVVTRFNELPLSIQETLTVIVKGVRNITGI
ncbi:hypothetical protein ACT453_41310, partial [Bacillus sp. D-CC]